MVGEVEFGVFSGLYGSGVWGFFRFGILVVFLNGGWEFRVAFWVVGWREGVFFWDFFVARGFLEGEIGYFVVFVFAFKLYRFMDVFVLWGLGGFS